METFNRFFIDKLNGVKSMIPSILFLFYNRLDLFKIFFLRFLFKVCFLLYHLHKINFNLINQVYSVKFGYNNFTLR